MVEKFSDRFSRFDTIPECDSHRARHVAVAITLNAKLSSLKAAKICYTDGKTRFSQNLALPLGLKAQTAVDGRSSILAEYWTS